MRRQPSVIVSSTLSYLVLSIALDLDQAGQAQTLGPDYQGSYTVRDIGVPTEVPGFFGSVLFKPGDDSTLLMGGYLPEGEDKEIFELKVQRDAQGHISGFSGSAVLVLHAPGDPAAMGTSGLYSGLDYGPNGVLFYATWDASIAQIQSGSMSPSRYLRTEVFGIDGRVSGVGFVPAGFPGAGRLKLTSYLWHDTSVTPDASGTFDIAVPTTSVDVIQGDGFLYAKKGLPGFADPAVLVTFGGEAKVNAYSLAANGDPVVASERPFLTDFAAPRGAITDPRTGDFVFSSADVGRERLVVVGSLEVATPVVALTAPAAGSRFRAPATFSLAAEATQAGGSIGRVEFYQNTQLIATLIPPSILNVLVEDLGAAEYDFSAIAYDAGGRSATSQVVHVSVVNEGPIISRFAPTNNTTLRACSDLWLTAEIQKGNSDFAQIEFRDGTSVLATLPGVNEAGMARFQVRHVPEGVHDFWVQATDLNGLSASAAGTNVVVEPLPLHTLFIHHYEPAELLLCFKGVADASYVWEWTASLQPVQWAPFLTNPAPAGLWQITNQFNEATPSGYFRTRKAE